MTAVAPIERIAVPKSCDLLADQLRRQILAGTWVAGEPLPPERDLVAQSGLSRGSVREALRILEAEGFIRTRAGRYGGSIVVRPSDDSLGRQIERFARGRSVPLAALIDAREAVEPMVARLAALHRTDDDLQALRDISARLEAASATASVAAFVAENARWHDAVAVASHNDLLRAFMGSLSGLIGDRGRLEPLLSAPVRAEVVQTHRRILAAIEVGDSDAARRRMGRHLGAYSQAASGIVGEAGRVSPEAILFP